MTTPRAAPSLPGNLSTLFARPSIWSDWLPQYWVSPLSWTQLVAMLMQGAPPEPIINRLAPMLQDALGQVTEEFTRYAETGEADLASIVRYDIFGEAFMAALGSRLPDVLDCLPDDADIVWLRERLRSDGGWSDCLLWFLLNGIAQAQIDAAIDAGKIDPDASWLAELDFHEPAALGNDEVLLRSLYNSFRLGFKTGVPLPKKPYSTYRRYVLPQVEDEDPCYEQFDRARRRLLGSAARLPLKSAKPVDLPEDAWDRARSVNRWDSALTIANVPFVSWLRQVAFLLRDVSLSEVIRRIMTALDEMADQTARQVLADASARGCPAHEIEFGLWFKWWREHFRHWGAPMRSVIEPLCTSGDAERIGTMLVLFEPVIFADFLVRCVHGDVIRQQVENRSAKIDPAVAELFEFNPNGPQNVMGIHGLSIGMWRRFADAHGIAHHLVDYRFEFDVNWNVPFAANQ